MEAAAEFAFLLGLDGSWTMNTATNDVVAAFRRVACADPRVGVSMVILIFNATT